MKTKVDNKADNTKAVTDVEKDISEKIKNIDKRTEAKNREWNISKEEDFRSIRERLKK